MCDLAALKALHCTLFNVLTVPPVITVSPGCYGALCNEAEIKEFVAKYLK